MPHEIERKYLVKDDSWRAAAATRRLLDQGYLSVEPERTMRIRVSEDKAFVTIKGRKIGAAAPEFEYAIPVADAEAMFLLLPMVGRIRKMRHEIIHQGRKWEVDEFLDENRGLVVAELELGSEGEVPALPKWVGAEVTADHRYANSSLALKPFTRWSSKLTVPQNPH